MHLRVISRPSHLLDKSNMPKRKLALAESTELSDLSPPPDGLLDTTQAVAGAEELNGVAKLPASKKRKTKQIKEEVAGELRVNGTSPARATRKKEVKYEEAPDSDEQPKPATPKGKKRKVTVKEEVEVKEDVDGEKKAKKKRKTKEEKEAEAMPLAARTVGHKLFIGAHVSSAGGTLLSLMNTSRVCMLRIYRRCPQLRR